MWLNWRLFFIKLKNPAGVLGSFQRSLLPKGKNMLNCCFCRVRTDSERWLKFGEGIDHGNDSMRMSTI